MKVHTATLAGGDNNQDRIFVTENAVIVLDGASAFGPVDVDAGHYAETLGEVIAEQLSQGSGLAIADAVKIAVTHAVQKLGLKPGESPSSTVSVLRRQPHAVDLYALGDSSIHYGAGDGPEQFLTDRRLAAVALKERDRYVSRLRNGHGYDAEHRARLAELQRAQRTARNRRGGYWIAEAVPDAANHAITASIKAEAIDWAVLVTDGADKLGAHLGVSWHDIAGRNPEELAAMLNCLNEWEANFDPWGLQLPRAKVHDDKSLASTRFC